MSFTDQLPGVTSELNRQSQGAYRRGLNAGKREKTQEVITELEKLYALRTEFEIRDQLPRLIKYLQEKND